MSGAARRVAAWTRMKMVRLFGVGGVAEIWKIPERGEDLRIRHLRHSSTLLKYDRQTIIFAFLTTNIGLTFLILSLGVTPAACCRPAPSLLEGKKGSSLHGRGVALLTNFCMAAY